MQKSVRYLKSAVGSASMAEASVVAAPGKHTDKVYDSSTVAVSAVALSTSDADMAAHSSWADDSTVEGWDSTREDSVTTVSTVDAGMALCGSWADDSA